MTPGAILYGIHTFDFAVIYTRLVANIPIYVMQLLGLGDTEKEAPRYIVKVFITIIDIITILTKTCYLILPWLALLL